MLRACSCMVCSLQGALAEEYEAALVRSAADTRFAQQHGPSCYYVLEAVLTTQEEAAHEDAT